jgi:tetratricopeptide (TPR) repeat protein
MGSNVVDLLLENAQFRDFMFERLTEPDRVESLMMLGRYLRNQFDETNMMENLNQAIDIMEEAVVVNLDTNAAGFISRSNYLGEALLARFQRTGGVNDLHRAISVWSDLVLAVDNPSELSMLLSNLGSALWTRFRMTGALDDLERSITAKEQALALAPEGYSDLPMLFNNLGNCLLSRFERTNSVEDLDRAVRSMEQGVALSPTNHMLLNNLGATISRRFERSNSTDDIDRAISVAERSIELTPQDHPQLPTYLDNLAHSLHRRFGRTGSTDDLDRAITVGMQAISLCTISDHHNIPMYHDNLGNALRSRFEHTGSTVDLDHSISSHDKGLALTESYDSSVVGRLNSLSIALMRRFERTSSMTDIDRAISVSEQSLALTPSDHPIRRIILLNLSNSLQRRSELTEALDERVIELLDQAVCSTAEDHADLATIYHSWGIALKRQFEHTKSLDDINLTIVKMEQAVALTPDESPDLATRLHSLGNAIRLKSKETGAASDLNSAIDILERAVSVQSAPPFDRILAADSALDLLRTSQPDRSKSLLRVAVSLLPLVSPRVLKQSDQQHNIARFSGMTSRAASISLECGEDPFDALQLLELGRGVLASLHLEVRSDISVLRASHPDLGRQLDSLRDQLDHPVYSIEQRVPNSVSETERRRALSKNFDSLLFTIRQLEGFERFLLGHSASEVMTLAAYGPIVMFNISNYRSDALIIEKQGIRSLPLPLLTNQALESHAMRFLEATHSVTLKNYADATDRVKAVLKWLWDVAVGPVLDELQFNKMPAEDDAWPRVWWVGCGLLNLLPIHAAGYHDSKDQPPRSAIDRIISSYTPTIKALAYARERATTIKVCTEVQRVALIGMCETPGHQDLRFVRVELDDLQKLLPPEIQTTVIEHPTKANVLPTLRDHQIVHFACHGESALGDPSESKLLLSDWQTSPLTVSNLTSLNIKSPELAYLSACHTGSSLDIRILDESIHLASAVQLAGYPSVIGTLWSVTDVHSASHQQNWQRIIGTNCALFPHYSGLILNSPG